MSTHDEKQASADAALAEERAEIERLRRERDEHKAAAEGALQGQQDALAAYDAEAGKRIDVIRALGAMRARAETAEKELAESRRFHGLAQEEILRERNAANVARAAAEAAEKRLADARDLLRDWRGLMTSWTFGARAKETLDYCAKQLAKSLGEDWR